MTFHPSHYHSCPSCQARLHWAITPERRYAVQCETRTCVWFRDPHEGATLDEAVEKLSTK